MIFFLFVIAVYTGCTTTPPKGWEEHVESMLAVRDCSFPVTGEVVATKTFASVIEYPKRKEPPPEADILLTGQVYSPWYSWRTYILVRPVKLKNQGGDKEIFVYLLPEYSQRYRWNGLITADGYSAGTTIDFKVYADEDGNDKHFILTKAAIGEVRLEFDDPLDISTGLDVPPFPYLIGYVHTASNVYRVFAVLDNYPDKTIYHNEVFFNPLQVFQFLDEQDTVIAELEQNRYTVYDTAPETERDGLQNAASLLVAFRHSTTVMRNLEDRWGPPWFYRYVF